jgi:hypothetical protein
MASNGKPRSDLDKEVSVIKQVTRLLSALSPQGRSRVLGFVIAHDSENQPGPQPENQPEPPFETP